MDKSSKAIEDMKRRGKFKALPIMSTNKQTGALIAIDGIEFHEFWANDSTWVPIGELHDGSIRYLGSASHAGHIELKALYVLLEGTWYNIISKKPDIPAEPLAAPMFGFLSDKPDGAENHMNSVPCN